MIARVRLIAALLLVVVPNASWAAVVCGIDCVQRMETQATPESSPGTGQTCHSPAGEGDVLRVEALNDDACRDGSASLAAKTERIAARELQGAVHARSVDLAAVAGHAAKTPMRVPHRGDHQHSPPGTTPLLRI